MATRPRTDDEPFFNQQDIARIVAFLEIGIALGPTTERLADVLLRLNEGLIPGPRWLPDDVVTAIAAFCTAQHQRDGGPEYEFNVRLDQAQEAK